MLGSKENLRVSRIHHLGTMNMFLSIHMNDIGIRNWMRGNFNLLVALQEMVRQLEYIIWASVPRFLAINSCATKLPTLLSTEPQRKCICSTFKAVLFTRDT